MHCWRGGNWQCNHHVNKICFVHFWTWHVVVMCTVFLHRRDSQFPFISLLSNRTQAPECHRVFNTICYMAATICNLLCHAARWSCLRSLAFTDQHILATWVGNTTHTHTPIHLLGGMLLKQCGDPIQRNIPCNFCPMEALWYCCHCSSGKCNVQEPKPIL